MVPRDKISEDWPCEETVYNGTGSSFCFCSYNSRRWLLEIHALSTVHSCSLQWTTMTVVPPLTVSPMCPWRPWKRASTAVEDAHWQGHALVCKVWCLADDGQRKALALCSFTVWAGYTLLVSWKTVRSVATWWGNKALSHRGSAKNGPCFSSLLHTLTMTSWNIPGHVHVYATNMTILSAGQQIPGNGKFLQLTIQ